MLWKQYFLLLSQYFHLLSTYIYNNKKRRILDQNNCNRQPVAAMTCGSWQLEIENINGGGGWITDSGG